MMRANELITMLDQAFEKRVSGNYVEALDEFLALERLSTHSKDISALRLYETYCLMDLGRSNDALERINTVREEDLEESLRANYEYQFARVLYALGRVHEAIAHAEGARRLFETLSDELLDSITARNTQILLGILFAECKRCDEATELLHDVTIRDQSWQDAKMRLGDCYMENKQYREAIECYSAIAFSDLAIDSVVKMDAIRNIGCSYYWLGEYAKSVNYLNKVKDAYGAYPELERVVLNFLALGSSRLR